jgi:hypothetical protein
MKIISDDSKRSPSTYAIKDVRLERDPYASSKGKPDFELKVVLKPERQFGRRGFWLHP